MIADKPAVVAPRAALTDEEEWVRRAAAEALKGLVLFNRESVPTAILSFDSPLDLHASGR